MKELDEDLYIFALVGPSFMPLYKFLYNIFFYLFIWGDRSINMQPGVLEGIVFRS